MIKATLSIKCHEIGTSANIGLKPNHYEGSPLIYLSLGVEIEATLNIRGHKIGTSAEIGPKPVIIRGHMRYLS